MAIKKTRTVLYFFAMVFIILNSKNATRGAVKAIELCFYTVIPALFPFCILSTKFLEMTGTEPLRILRPLEKVLKLPPGGGTIFILGLLGGYPAGAMCAENSSLHSEEKNIIASFCNNAGPAFIFGIVYGLFSLETVLKIWFIQILSALTSCILLNRVITPKLPINKSSIGKQYNPITSMVNVCTTIIIFKTLMSCIPLNWMAQIPEWIRVFLIGSLELTNGVTILSEISNINIRFIICCALLSFGGLCVAMQITSISKCIKIKTYIKGKIIQTIISVLLAIFSIYLPILTILFPCIIIILRRYIALIKNPVAFYRSMRYNKKKSRRSNHVISKKAA